MGYNISTSGRRADALSAMRSQAGAQLATIQSPAERAALDEAVNRAEKDIMQYAGDTDSVSISISGHVSQAESALGISQSVGVSISKAIPSKAVADAKAMQAASSTDAPISEATSAATGRRASDVKPVV